MCAILGFSIFFFKHATPTIQFKKKKKKNLKKKLTVQKFFNQLLTIVFPN